MNPELIAHLTAYHDTLGVTDFRRGRVATLIEELKRGDWTQDNFTLLGKASTCQEIIEKVQLKVDKDREIQELLRKAWRMATDIIQIANNPSAKRGDGVVSVEEIVAVIDKFDDENPVYTVGELAQAVHALQLRRPKQWTREELRKLWWVDALESAKSGDTWQAFADLVNKGGE